MRRIESLALVLIAVDHESDHAFFHGLDRCQRRAITNEAGASDGDMGGRSADLDGRESLLNG